MVFNEIFYKSIEKNEKKTTDRKIGCHNIAADIWSVKQSSFLIILFALFKISSVTTVQAAMKKLLELDLITLDNGCYTIPDHFLALYLRKLVGMDDCV